MESAGPLKPELGGGGGDSREVSQTIAGTPGVL